MLRTMRLDSRCIRNLIQANSIWMTVDLILEAGQISLHDVFLAHGSEPNRSANSRRGMTLRFMPTTSHYDRDIEAEQNWRLGIKSSLRRPVFLMRGTDRCGRNDFENETPLG